MCTAEPVELIREEMRGADLIKYRASGENDCLSNTNRMLVDNWNTYPVSDIF